MAIESTVMFRRVARIACLVLLAGLLPGVAAMAQLPIKAPAQVSVGSVVPFSHGSTGVWIQIYSMKQDPIYGHILFLDSAASVIYDMAPGASAPTEIVGPEPSNKNASDCSELEYKGSYWNAAVAFDKWDNLYVTDRYGSSVQFCRVPYDASSGTWAFTVGPVRSVIQVGPMGISGWAPLTPTAAVNRPRFRPRISRWPMTASRSM